MGKAEVMADLNTMVSATKEFIASEVLHIEDEFDGDVERAGGADLHESCSQSPLVAGCCLRTGPSTTVASD